MVEVGRTADSMPSCECEDWASYHWPCKHMCAVFQRTSYDWSSVSACYRDSVYFSIDTDVVEMIGVLPTSSSDAPPSVVDFDSDDDVTADDADNAAVQPGVSPQLEAADCRQCLKQICDLTYLCTDVTELRQLKCSLQSVYSEFAAVVPHEEGVALQSLPTRRAAKRRRRASQTDGSRQQELTEPASAQSSAADTPTAPRKSVDSLKASDDIPVRRSCRRQRKRQYVDTQPHESVEKQSNVDVIDTTAAGTTESSVLLDHSAETQPRVSEDVNVTKSSRKRIRFAEATQVKTIRDYFGSSQQPDTERAGPLPAVTTAPTHADVVSPLMHLMGTPEFISRVTLANIRRCIRDYRRLSCSCCKITVTETDMMSLLPGNWLCDNVSIGCLSEVVVAGCPRYFSYAKV